MNQSLTIRYKPLFWLAVLMLPVINAAMLVFFGKEPNFLLFFSLALISASLIVVLFVNIKIAFFIILLLRTIADFQNSFLSGFSVMGVNFAGILSIIIVVAGIYYIVVNRARIIALPISKPFIALLVLALISILLSAKIADGFQDWLRLLSLYIVYTVFSIALKNNKDIKQIVTVLLVSIVIPATVAFYQLFTGTGNLETVGFNRLLGTFAHPMQFSYYLLFIITLLLVLSLESKRKDLIFFAVSSCFFLGVLLYNTYTRAAWLGLVAVLLILGYLRYRKLLAVLPVFLIIITIFFSSNVSSRFDDLNLTEQKAAGEQGNSLDSRFRTWSDTVPLFLKNPVIGNGYGTSSTVTDDATHNDYLKMLAETGVLGFCAFLWLILATVRLAWKSFITRQSAFYKGLALVFFVQTIIIVIFSFDSNMLRNIALQWSFWALAAVIYESTLLEKETKEQTLNSLKFA